MAEMTEALPTRREVEEAVHAPPMQRVWEFMETVPKQTYYFAMAGSILLSLGLFLFKKRDWGLFVGLWPPTIINFALMNRLLRPSKGT